MISNRHDTKEHELVGQFKNNIYQLSQMILIIEGYFAQDTLYIIQELAIKKQCSFYC